MDDNEFLVILKIEYATLKNKYVLLELENRKLKKELRGFKIKLESLKIGIGAGRDDK